MCAIVLLFVVFFAKIHPAINKAIIVNTIKKPLFCEPIPKTAPSLSTNLKFNNLPGIATTPLCGGIGDHAVFDKS
tara:strand:+ start:1285 stop:1509 length:225 start_codon:yes stop_codon:yes gene_type:complete